MWLPEANLPQSENWYRKKNNKKYDKVVVVAPVEKTGYGLRHEKDRQQIAVAAAAAAAKKTANHHFTPHIERDFNP